jgi:hypothetical protein
MGKTAEAFFAALLSAQGLLLVLSASIRVHRRLPVSHSISYVFSRFHPRKNGYDGKENRPGKHSYCSK